MAKATVRRVEKSPFLKGQVEAMGQGKEWECMEAES